MKDLKNNIIKASIVFLVLLLLVPFSIIIFIIKDRDKVITSSYNPRIKYDNTKLKRGTIFDSDNNVLAITNKEEENYIRYYPYGDIFAHVVGNIDFGKSGIEAKEHFQLEHLDLEIIQRFKNYFLGQELVGNSLVLTLNANLQEMIYKDIADKKAAVVVMEPSTGKILSMVSLPSYDPNNFDLNWDNLKIDENSSLLNRATQGLYPPGSVFKIVTSLAGIRNLEDYTSYIYECLGEAIFENSSIRCFNLVAHGVVGMKEALAYSCNTYYASLVLNIDKNDLKDTAQGLLFNKEYSFELDYVRSSFVMDDSSSESEAVETSIGQGKTLVTPLHMAMITSAVANGGIMMEPYLVDYSVNYNGKKKSKTLPVSINRVMTIEESEIIKDMMVEVVEEGTAKNINNAKIKIAGKTGTAENAQGEDHGWFIGFAPADNPQVVVSILLENSDGPRDAILLAKKIFESTIEI